MKNEFFNVENLIEVVDEIRRNGDNAWEIFSIVFKEYSSAYDRPIRSYITNGHIYTFILVKTDHRTNECTFSMSFQNK